MVDDASIGFTDEGGQFYSETIEPGERIVSITKAGFKPHIEEKTFGAGFRTSVTARLAVEVFNVSEMQKLRLVPVRVTTDVSPSNIFVDGLFVGRMGDSGILILDLPPGERKIVVKSEFQEIAEKIVDLPAASNLVAVFVLKGAYTGKGK